MFTVHAPAGIRTVIRKRSHSSLIHDYHFSVRPAAPGGVVSGVLEVTASQWIFPGTPQRLPLQENHSVRAGMWNTFFEIAVIPESPVVITFTDHPAGGAPPLPGRSPGLRWLVLAVVVLAAAMVLFTLFS